MRRSTEPGFSLLEAIVAVAIMAIMAGAVAPLAIRALNQAREQKTRENLKTAWEAMFGARDRRVANMRADFGFDPLISLTDLRFLTNRTGVYPAAQTPQAYAYDITAGYSWGWNGPYWTGPVNSATGLPGGIPVDGWARPFRLIYNSSGYQLLSAGPDGNPATASDNIVYPPSPLSVSALSGTLAVQIWNKTGAEVTEIEIGIQQRTQADKLPAQMLYFSRLKTANPKTTPGAPDIPGTGLTNGANITMNFTNLLPGPVSIFVLRTNYNSPPTLPVAIPVTYTADLLPGEGRVVDLVIN